MGNLVALIQSTAKQIINKCCNSSLKFLNTRYGLLVQTIGFRRLLPVHCSVNVFSAIAFEVIVVQSGTAI